MLHDYIVCMSCRERVDINGLIGPTTDNCPYCGGQALPILADSGGSLIVGSTFNGKNWFYEKVKKASGNIKAVARHKKGEKHAS